MIELLMTSLRVRLDRKLLPLARSVKVSPNLITACGFLVMALAGALAMQGQLWGAGILILVSGLLDLLDGAVAKATACTTRFGGLLDRVADRAGDFAILAGIILGGGVALWLGLYVLATVLLASYISACLEAATSSSIGQRFSLRAVRLTILALACFTGRLVEGMVLLALIGSYATGARLWIAYRLLR